MAAGAGSPGMMSYFTRTAGIGWSKIGSVGSDGRIDWAEFDREEAALDRIRDLLDGPGEWRELG